MVVFLLNWQIMKQKFCKKWPLQGLRLAITTITTTLAKSETVTVDYAKDLWPLKKRFTWGHI